MDNYVIYYGLTFIALIITLGAQWFVHHNYKKYLKFVNSKGLKGSEVARKILDINGLQNVPVVEVNGFLSDHYDPTKKVVRLSKEIYDLNTISSVAVAAHECGHAIQDKNGYFFMKIRSFIAPFASFSSYAGYIAILIGCIFGLFDLILLGIALELVILAFQLVTLPVEFDASHRALKILKEESIIDNDEVAMCRKVLTAAALTYVAGVAATVLEMLRLILMFTRKD